MTKRMTIRIGLTVAVLCLTCLIRPTTARAGHYVWRFQGIHSHWEYVPDASDYSTLSGPSQGPQVGPAKPQAPRPPSQPQRPHFVINQAGHTYVNNIYVGQANRVRFRSGHTGWAFQIPRGWFIYRYDHETTTRAHS
jgi:hypothetical protein